MRTRVIDIESTGLDPISDRLLCTGIETDDKIKVFVPGELEGRLLVDRSDEIIVGANISFDLQWFLDEFQLPKCAVHDIQFMHYLLDENYPYRGLKHLHLVYTPYGDYEPDRLPYELEPEELYKYNARDIKSTRLVYEGIRRELGENEVRYRTTLGLMSQVQPILAAMSRTGIKIDTRKLEQTVRSEEEKVDNLENELALLWAKHSQSPSINMNSHRELSDFLFKELKLKIPRHVKDYKNKDGSISTRKQVLAEVEDHTGFVDKLQEFKYTRDNYRKYVKNIERYVRRDGRAHPQYFTYKSSGYGTVTGRLSIKNPPMHNIPKGHTIRECIIPFTEGSYLVQMDLSQIELVGAAYLSQDPVLIEDITSKDVHQEVVKLARSFGANITRDEAKIVNYGVFYGVGSKGLASQTTLSQSQASKLLDYWFKRYQGVAQWVEQTKAKARRQGYSETPYGRRRNFPRLGWKRRQDRWSYERESVNFPVQAWASDLNLIILLGMNQLVGYDEETWPLTVIHDSILWHTEEPEYLIDKLSEYFQDHYKGDIKNVLGMEVNVPISGEVKRGKNWYDMETVCQV